MGAIAGSARFLDEALIRELGIGAAEIDLIVKREQAVIQRREELWRGGKPPLELHKRSVIMVDDGLATGSTMLAAARFVRSLHAAALTIAVPVGSRQACAHLRTECDSLVCLATPEPFYAVGMWYEDFRQVEDAEVQDLLSRSRHMMTNGQMAPVGK
jgi:predicted phosphoribosyltransferase